MPSHHRKIWKWVKRGRLSKKAREGSYLGTRERRIGKRYRENYMDGQESVIHLETKLRYIFGPVKTILKPYVCEAELLKGR